MALEFLAQDEGPLWVVKVTGVASSLQDLESIEDKVKGVVLENYSKRVLLDETDMILSDGLDMSLFAEQAGGRELSLHIRVACLANEGNMKLNKQFEASFANQSVDFKVFDKRSEAYLWLMK